MPTDASTKSSLHKGYSAHLGGVEGSTRNPFKTRLEVEIPIKNPSAPPENVIRLVLDIFSQSGPVFQ